jgi:hypothetical protein
LLGTFGLFGMTALLVAWITWPELRARLLSTAASLTVALFIAALALSPILVQVFAVSGMGRRRVWTDSGIDLFELIVPGRFLLMGEILGRYGAAAHQHFAREVEGYAGLPLLVLAIVFFRALGRATRTVPGLDARDCRCRGVRTVAALSRDAAMPMPSKLFDKLPLINSAPAALHHLSRIDPPI